MGEASKSDVGEEVRKAGKRVVAAAPVARGVREERGSTMTEEGSEPKASVEGRKKRRRVENARHMEGGPIMTDELGYQSIQGWLWPRWKGRSDSELRWNQATPNAQVKFEKSGPAWQGEGIEALSLL